MPPAPQSVAREARDMRERRDVERLDFRFVSPVPPVSRVSHAILCGVLLLSQTYRSMKFRRAHRVFPQPVKPDYS